MKRRILSIIIVLSVLPLFIQCSQGMEIIFEENKNDMVNYALIGSMLAIPVIYVDVDAAPGSTTGSSWSDAFDTVQEGIDAAFTIAQEKGLCEVWVAEGTYYIYNAANTDTIQLMSNVNLYGGFTGDENSISEREWINNETIISGYNSAAQTNQVLHVVTGSDDAIIDGFTISDGLANIDDSPAAVTRAGGGMYNVNVSPVVTNCKFINNSANTGVQSGRGGAIYNNSSSATISNCFFYNNYSDYYGGAIYNRNTSSLTITNCVFIDNDANNGSAIANDTGTGDIASITNCSFTLNGNVNTYGSIVNNNTASIVTNCILFGNTRDAARPSVYNSGSGSCTLSYSIVEGGDYDSVADHITSGDPLFAGGAATSPGYAKLSVGSPAINEGNSAVAPVLDFEYYIRSTPDIGAYEYH